MIDLQTYIGNIKKKTGKTPADFKKLATAKGYFENGVMKPTVKATAVMAWLKEDFELGRGHALAIYHILKGDI